MFSQCSKKNRRNLGVGWVKFLEVINGFKEFDKFPQYKFSEIIGGIDVHEVTKEPKTVKIDIRYKHIGQIDYEKQKPCFTTFSQRYRAINYRIS
jgi:hypothetical protein